jgi:hypothetical protein
MMQSFATIDSPEFINLQPLDINPLMSSCEIKVLYTGENRNKTILSKDVVMEMAKTLRGAPIVGYYKEDTEDFDSHSKRITIDDSGVHFETLTIPYGFVSPDAKVWFQKFEETDNFGNAVIREYLMTTGYLWTGQFEECQRVIEQGNNQSMEIDQESLKGHYVHDRAKGMDFYIINDATFSKLCILGEDVEPCFEGASITAPNVSLSYSLDNNFKNTLYNMMQDLEFALKGGQTMNEDVNTPVVEDTVETPVEVETPVAVEEATETVVEVPAAAEYKKDDTDEEKEDAPKDEEETPKDKDKEDKEKYSLLETQYNNLSADFAALKAQYEELVEFKKSVEDAKKDELINSFYMLSEEDKKEVRENKTNYSLDDIEAKLSVICVRKKVNFDLDNNSKVDNSIEDTPAINFSLESAVADVPAWINAVKNTQNNRNN